MAFGGRSYAEADCRMLEEDMGCTVALQYNLNGKGKSGKKSFQQLRLFTIIYGEFNA